MSESKSKTIKGAYNRYGDQKYYLSKILSEYFLKKYPNPTFRKEDEKVKMDIFDIANTKTCFITGDAVNGVGDHFYEINGYYRKTEKRGIDDPWNILPVCGTRNKSYKIFIFTMNGKNIKKNIGYEALTVEELTFLLNSDEDDYVIMGDIYCKIHAWKMYVAQRGAIICYEEPEEFKKIRENNKQKYNEYWDDTIGFIGEILN
jgi:hypothetical protein